MRILTVTSLFPNNVEPNLGIFVENRIRYIRRAGDIDFRVVAPVPWFPFKSRRFGRYADFAMVERSEDRHGIRVDHPRVATVPKVGMHLAPAAVFFTLRAHVTRLMRVGYEFDLLEAHYFYPDGVAAAALALSLGKPLVISARGSDINVIATYPIPRTMIRWAGKTASASIAVSEALKRRMIEVGLEPDSVSVLRNGVDLETFRPMRFGMPRPDAPVLLTVGNLVEVKAQHRVVKALQHLPGARLRIVGKGEKETALRRLVSDLGLVERVEFLGAVGHADLADIYASADVLVHASRSEGWPNVLLESLACGTPVVATDVGGTGEIVTSDHAGRLVPERATPQNIAAAIGSLVRTRAAPETVRQHAETFSWSSVAEAQIGLYRRILENPGSQVT